MKYLKRLCHNYKTLFNKESLKAAWYEYSISTPLIIIVCMIIIPAVSLWLYDDDERLRGYDE